MIILEFLWLGMKWIFYYTARPIIWLITARDCRHCEYGIWSKGHISYYNPFNWDCDFIEYGRKAEIKNKAYECQCTPWRCHFERRGKK